MGSADDASGLFGPRCVLLTGFPSFDWSAVVNDALPTSRSGSKDDKQDLKRVPVVQVEAATLFSPVTLGEYLEQQSILAKSSDEDIPLGKGRAYLCNSSRP